MSRIEGRVIEVGWEPTTGSAIRVHALIKVKISTPRRRDRAEHQLNKLVKIILNKKVVIFIED